MVRFLTYPSISSTEPVVSRCDDLITDLAEYLVPLFDHLKLRKVIMGGHHTGSQIAVAFTARHPDPVTAVVMHGSAMFSDEEAAAAGEPPRILLPARKNAAGWAADTFPASADSAPYARFTSWSSNLKIACAARRVLVSPHRG